MLPILLRQRCHGRTVVTPAERQFLPILTRSFRSALYNTAVVLTASAERMFIFRFVITPMSCPTSRLGAIYLPEVIDVRRQRCATMTE